MSRESAKRAAAGGRRGGRVKAKKKAISEPPPPSQDRAPGRGKYDRGATADIRQKEQLRRLLDAAAHTFAEKGWAGATVEAIVSRTGMSRRTVYEHFGDLRECLLVLHQRVTKASFRAVEMRVEAANDDPGE